MEELGIGGAWRYANCSGPYAREECESCEVSWSHPARFTER